MIVIRLFSALELFDYNSVVTKRISSVERATDFYHMVSIFIDHVVALCTSYAFVALEYIKQNKK